MFAEWRKANCRRNEKNHKKKQPSKKLRFIPIPVGASRDDNPPVPIRHKRGFNYYYQGKVDNCVMGGLVNAVFWKMGPQQADKFLSNYTPAVINENLWDGFVQQINRSLTGYLMKRFMAETVPPVLRIGYRPRHPSNQLRREPQIP